MSLYVFALYKLTSEILKLSYSKSKRSRREAGCTVKTEEGFVSEFNIRYLFASLGNYSFFGKITLQERWGMKRPVNQDDM